jgi:transcriptional regulator of acetoin/glycerol metabolism
VSQEQCFIQINTAWEQFISTGQFDPCQVRPIIARSWKRCREIGINPYFVEGQEVISQQCLKDTVKTYSNLMTIAKPFMKALYEFVAGSGFLVLLTDNNGIVLEIIGDQEVAELAKNAKLGIGANLSESKIGTNTIGTILIEKVPIQVVAKEHYCTVFHEWTCSAAPICDFSGSLYGVLNVSGYYERVHSHTLGMVVAAVKAIENELRLAEIYDKLRAAYDYSNTLIESISDGLVSVDAQGNITHLNSIAKKMLSYDITGHNYGLKSCLEYLVSVVKKGYGCTDKEMFLDTNQVSKRLIITAVPVKNSQGKPIGAVATLKESKEVHRLVANMVRENAKFIFNDLIGTSPKFQEAVQLARQISKSDAIILLQGESGTGKELFAQAIHNNSLRKNGPFIAVNCAALPRELIGSELFGYEEGAFTGAKKGGCPGKFELANGGSIFLDEIGDMPLDLQVNLLRVLQEKAINRLGGHRVISIDVRIIAATNKDLARKVSQGDFREDLYYRLNVITINLPPLRERENDMFMLVDYFIGKLNTQLQKNITGLSPEVERLFANYPWPGNIREMQNLLERAMHLVDSRGTLLLKHFREIAKIRDDKAMGGKLTLRTLKEVERQTILTAIAQFNGNISHTAKVLGIARNTLYSKLKELEIDNVQKTNSAQ